MPAQHEDQLDAGELLQLPGPGLPDGGAGEAVSRRGEHRHHQPHVGLVPARAGPRLRQRGLLPRSE